LSRKEFPFSIEKFFEPFVWRWLHDTEEQITQWCINSIAEDDFQAIDPDGEIYYSSSIKDIFSSFNESVDFLRGLRWTDELPGANFTTSLAKVNSLAVW
jgi:hypothetical protein